MPIDSDLGAAGRRAAAQHVPSAPSVATLEAGAARHTSRRRLIMSSGAALVLVALAFPLALAMRGSTTVQTVAAGTGQAAAAQIEPTAMQEEPGDDDGDIDIEADADLQIQLRTSGDFSLSIQVLSGEQAIDAAEAAAASATETLDVDGMTVWVSGTGDERTVSALVGPQEFIEVTSSATELDKLIDVLRDGELSDRGDPHGLDGFGNTEWQEFFDQFDDDDFNFDFDGDRDRDGHAFNIDELLREFEGEFDDLDELFGPDGDFSEFFGRDGEFNFDSDGFSLDGDFSEFFGPDGEFNFDSDGFSVDGDFGEFFGPDGEFTFPTDAFGQNFDGCIVIDQSDGGTGGSFHAEFPEGCGSADGN